MELKISNIGKIRSAKVRFDGLTVICGNNNTGKSTVGKILFALFNSMCDFESKINSERNQRMAKIIYHHLVATSSEHIDDFMKIRLETAEYFNTISANSDEPLSIEDMRSLMLGFFQQFDVLKKKEKLVEEIMHLFSTENDALFTEYVGRYFEDTFNGQIKTLNRKKVPKIEALFHDGKNVITVRSKGCKIDHQVRVLHRAYYIDNPFVLDQLNNPYSRISGSFATDLEKNVIQAIRLAKAERAADKMSDIFESVANKEKLDSIYKVLRKAYSGETIIDDGRYFYRENGRSIDIRNISTGLKSFTLIEQLLESGKLKQKDVLILDEPEIHLHPEWQTIYAEMIVLLQKTFDLTILVATHSFHFLEALQFFMKKHGIADRGNYYIPEEKEDGVEILPNDDNINKMLRSLSQASFDLADEKYNYEMEQNNECEDDNE